MIEMKLDEQPSPAVGQRFELEPVNLEDDVPQLKYHVELFDGRTVDIVADCHGFDMQGGVRFGIGSRLVAAFAAGIWRFVKEQGNV